MLCNPDKTFNSMEILNHSWIVKKASNIKEILSDINIKSLK